MTRHKLINAAGPFCDLDLRCVVPAGATLRAAFDRCRFIPFDPEITASAALLAESAPAPSFRCSNCLQLERKLEAAEMALRWYADRATWRQWLPDTAGDRARRALDVIKGVDRSKVGK